MALNTEVFTIEGWKRFISDSIAKLYAVTTALIDVYDKARSSNGKYFYEVDELIRNAFISGLKDDGDYSQNALALFYRDVLGISLEDSKLLVRLLKSGRKPTVKVVGYEPSFWYYIVNIKNVSEFIIKNFHVEASPIRIERPRDLYDRFLEFLNLIINLLPQYNQYTFLAFTLAQNTYKYLREISKPENNIYPNIIENKDLLNVLGITKIIEAPEDEYSLWGYNDHIVYDKKSNSVLGFQLSKSFTPGTIGGAICRLIENIFELIKNATRLITDWVINMPKEDPEVEYVRFVLESIKGTELENPGNYTTLYNFYSTEYIRRTDGKFGERTNCTDREYFHYSYYVDDNDYIVRRRKYREYCEYKTEELKNRFSLWEYLDNYSPLMFLGVLYVVFIEPMREFAVLVRPNPSVFNSLYSNVLGGARG